MTALPPTAAEARSDFGPPPPGPVMCFPCVVATCGHRGRCGGMIPALTYLNGTALCLDCASRAAR